MGCVVVSRQREKRARFFFFRFERAAQVCLFQPASVCFSCFSCVLKLLLLHLLAENYDVGLDILAPEEELSKHLLNPPPDTDTDTEHPPSSSSRSFALFSSAPVYTGVGVPCAHLGGDHRGCGIGVTRREGGNTRRGEGGRRRGLVRGCG